MTIVAALTSTALGGASADHIVFADAQQAGATPDGGVTLLFTLTTLGAPIGGAWMWSTGDGAGGWLDDGFEDGEYEGDAEGVGFLSDGRAFRWARVGAQASLGGAWERPGEVAYAVSYEYARSGVYAVSWKNCCRDADATILVTALDAEDPTAMPHAPAPWLNVCDRLDEATVHCMQKWMMRGLVRPEVS